MKSNLGIGNAVAVISKFNRSIAFSLVRFGPKQFGFICNTTGKRMFLTWKTRLDAAVGITSRYYSARADKDSAWINPKSVALAQGLPMSFDLLLAAGFVKIEREGNSRRAVAVL